MNPPECEPSAGQLALDILQSITDSLVVVDHNFNFIFVNDRFLEYTGRWRGELLGACMWNAFPRLAVSSAYQACLQAQRDRIPTVFFYRHEPSGRCFENRVYPAVSGLAILAKEITDGEPKPADPGTA